MQLISALMNLIISHYPFPEYNGRKRLQKLQKKALQWLLVINIWYLLNNGYYKHTMTDVVVWLSYYVYSFSVWTYLTTINQCLTFYFQAIICHKNHLH